MCFEVVPLVSCLLDFCRTEIKVAFDQSNKTVLSNALMLVRQCSLEGSHVFPAYSNWFQVQWCIGLADHARSQPLCVCTVRPHWSTPQTYSSLALCAISSRMDHLMCGDNLGLTILPFSHFAILQSMLVCTNAMHSPQYWASWCVCCSTEPLSVCAVVLSLLVCVL